MAGGPDPGTAQARAARAAWQEEEAAYARPAGPGAILVGIALQAGAALSIALEMPPQAYAPNAGTAFLFCALGVWAAARAVVEVRLGRLFFRDPAFARDGLSRLWLLFPPALGAVVMGFLALALLCAGLLLSGFVPAIRDAIAALVFSMRFLVLWGA